MRSATLCGQPRRGKVDREVQVHVRIQSEAENVLRGVACALELLDAPVDDPVVLGGGLEFEDRHRASCDDRRRLPLSTRKGDLPHIRRCFDTNGVRYKRGQTPDMAATDDRSGWLCGSHWPMRTVLGSDP